VNHRLRGVRGDAESVAEKMPFLNDTPIFRDTAGFPAN